MPKLAALAARTLTNSDRHTVGDALPVFIHVIHGIGWFNGALTAVAADIAIAIVRYMLVVGEI